ncbi:MAG: bifunctional tRNA (5-methylaminomethyl-2-thiouridine)(34)-methyltransferase MnmD/FAD-dependent 5-carboxymethylaminomethyl-2-thiouridine(34) oxidoreductase MnmC [Pseudomonadota bacterium]
MTRPAHPTITPARLSYAADGTPYSEAYGDVYHSAHGGLGQARHVFLAGNCLPQRWQGREQFVVLETGFGLGLNFLATWQAWRDDPRRCERLHFVSVEKHPFTRADLAALHARFPELAAYSQQLLARWPPLAPGLHRLHFEQGRVTLTLALGDAQALLPRIACRADAIYLDGFAPGKNPELWSQQLCRDISVLARNGATLATWSVAAPVRAALTTWGWQLEKRPGYAGKREMLCGQVTSAISAANGNERAAVVIGAGIAGAAMCERLAARGWNVTLLEREAGPAQAASGNHAGVLLPIVSKDDRPAARLSRTCYLYALNLLRELADEGKGLIWSQCGVAQLARDAKHERQQRDAIAALRLPADFARFLERDAMSALLDHAAPIGGWYFPHGAWVNPPSLCRALLARHPQRIRTLYGATVTTLEQGNNGEWRLHNQRGKLLATAFTVILANADAARSFVPHLPLSCARGQVSHLPGEALAALPCVVCRQGYVTPPHDGVSCLGATFDHDDDAGLRLASHLENLARLDRMLPGLAADYDAAQLDGRVGFRTVTPDKLPLAGILPGAAGMYGLLGLGARGLVWAPLAAELLAAQLADEPLPLENDLVAALDPSRFAGKAVAR